MGSPALNWSVFMFELVVKYQDSTEDLDRFLAKFDFNLGISARSPSKANLLNLPAIIRYFLCPARIT